MKDVVSIPTHFLLAVIDLYETSYQMSIQNKK